MRSPRGREVKEEDSIPRTHHAPPLWLCHYLPIQRENLPSDAGDPFKKIQNQFGNGIGLDVSERLKCLLDIVFSLFTANLPTNTPERPLRERDLLDRTKEAPNYAVYLPKVNIVFPQLLYQMLSVYIYVFMRRPVHFLSHCQRHGMVVTRSMLCYVPAVVRCTQKPDQSWALTYAGLTVSGFRFPL